MDLFIVNRHLDVEVQEQNDKAEEEAKIKATLDRIVKNRGLQAEKERRKKKAQRAQLKLSQQQRRADSKIFKVPERDDTFDDENVRELAEELTGESQISSTAVAESKQNDDQVGQHKAKKRKRKHAKIENGVIDGYTVLGVDDHQKQKKVKRVLPDWLAKPTIISTDLQNLQTKISSVKELSKHLRRKLKAEGHKFFFPVQAAVIPYLLKLQETRFCKCPNDVCVSAPTGSGKTLAFVLPIVQALESAPETQIRALVVLPTQDLATQVYKTFKKFCECTKLHVGLITSSTSFQQEQQQLLAKNVAFGFLSKVDILIATAGRLVEHLAKTDGFNLQHLEFLVIDEADRVLENVQNDWLYHLEKHIFADSPKDSNDLNISNYSSRKSPQKLLFSATLSQDPEKIHKLGLFQPRLFTAAVEGEATENEETSAHFVGKYTTPQELSEKFITCSMELKPLVLYQFIKNANLTKTLVFAHSADTAHRLKILLQSLFATERTVEEIGAKIDAATRNKLISSFSNGEVDVLVCTDALARGIDLPGVQCVISYGSPKHQKTYIHRAGRTARAGELGMAVTLLHEQQLCKFNKSIGGKRSMEKIEIDEDALLELSTQYKHVLEILKQTVRAEDVEQNKKIVAAKRLMPTGK